MQVANSNQYEELKELKEKSGRECEIFENSQCMSTKIVFYTYQNDFAQTETLKKGLQRNYKVCDFIPATWIRTRNTEAQAFLATFTSEKIPQYITITGEQAKTKLYDSIPNPLMCNKCQIYGHPEKYCESNTPVCGNCAEAGHRIETCRSTTLKCFHCEEPHHVGHTACRKHKEEEAIVTVQLKEKLARKEAIQHLQKINPDQKINYSRAVRTTGNPNRSNEVREEPLGRRTVNTINASRRHDGEISSMVVEEIESSGSSNKRI